LLPCGPPDLTDKPDIAGLGLDESSPRRGRGRHPDSLILRTGPETIVSAMKTKASTNSVHIVRRRCGLLPITEQSSPAQKRGTITELPAFTDREDHAKLRSPAARGYQPASPELFVQQWLGKAAAKLARPLADIRILDVGCGRGDTVFWLLDRGFDAWGIDINARYVEVGREYLRSTGRDPDRLQVSGEAATTFAGDWFDVVISDQVLEHVARLGPLIREISRISKPGALGMHIFPARWRPVEPHMGTPFVHWLPKGALRRSLLRVLLSAHVGADHFKDRPIRERVEIFGSFSDRETFYRSLSSISRVMRENGLKVDLATPSRSKVAHHAPWLPARYGPLAAWIYVNAFSVCMETVRL